MLRYKKHAFVASSLARGCIVFVESDLHSLLENCNFFWVTLDDPGNPCARLGWSFDDNGSTF